MAARRQLPILNQKMAPPVGAAPGLEGDEERPPWHWSAIGSVLIFTAWLPIAMVGQWISKRFLQALLPAMDAAQEKAWLASASAGEKAGVWAALVGPPLLGFAAACAAGGALVGRFGGAAGPKEAAVAGLVAASTAWALVAVQMGLGASWWLWPPAAGLGAVFAWAGGRWGLGKRGALGWGVFRGGRAWP